MAAQLTPDHRPLMARAEVMNHLRHHLLARSCFAQQENGGRRGRDLFDLAEHLLDGGALRDHRTRRPQHLDFSAKLRILQHDAIAQPADLLERAMQALWLARRANAWLMTPAMTRRRSRIAGAHACSGVIEPSTKALSARSSSPTGGRGNRAPDRNPRLRNASRSGTDRSSTVAKQQPSPVFRVATTAGIAAVGHSSGGEHEG